MAHWQRVSVAVACRARLALWFRFRSAMSGRPRDEVLPLALRVGSHPGPSIGRRPAQPGTSSE